MEEHHIYFELKVDAIKFIRSYHRKNPNKFELKNKLDSLKKAVAFYPLTSPEIFILMSVLMKNIGRFKKDTVQSFLLCCVPDAQLDKKIASDLMEWLLEKNQDANSEAKCLILIKWFCSMIKNNIIQLEDVDVYFIFLFRLIEDAHYLNAMCPLLFLLSTYENTLGWMLELLEQLKATNPQNRFVKMLAEKIKMNKARSQISGNVLVWPFAAGLPDMNKMLSLRLSHRLSQGHNTGVNDLATSDLSSEAQQIPLAIVPLEQIQTPEAFAHFFHIISLPQNIVSLLSSNLGVLKSILDSNIEDEFISRLKLKLTEMFLNNEKGHTEGECKALLEYLYKFQKMIQQGIDCVSNFLVLYLRTWNGLDYKEEILQLCEWFVFDSKVSLLNDFLLPMHTLLLTAHPDDKILYVEMYGKLYTNLLMESDKLVNKNESRMFMSLECSRKCDWMRNEASSLEVFSTLSKVIMEECCLAVLYTSSHRDGLLTCTLNVCLKCLTAEDYFNKPLLTVIPQCVVYLPLFSPMMTNISSVCFILDKYKQFHRSERFYAILNDFERDFIMIDGYIEDYINFLWRGTGWDERSMGVVFSNLQCNEAIEPLIGRYSHKQLNSSLHCRYHVALRPLAEHIMNNINGLDRAALTDEAFLNTILESLCPTISAFIKKYREENDQYMLIN